MAVVTYYVGQLLCYLNYKHLNHKHWLKAVCYFGSLRDTKKSTNQIDCHDIGGVLT